MKKVLLALIFVAALVGLLGTSSLAADATHGDLVIHFKAWNEDYTDLGSHVWGDASMTPKLADGIDSFGAYWNYNDVPAGVAVNFIAVYWANGSQDWNRKLTGDVNFGTELIVANETTNVYVFEGASGAQYVMADPAAANLIVVYYDPSGNYEDNLGLHYWNWDQTGPSWGTPAQILNTVGKSAAGIDVKAAILTASAANVTAGPGLLIYAGDDATKKTGDVTLAGAGITAMGDTGFAYVVSKGDAYTSGDNVYYNDYASFKDEAFSFKLMPFNNDDKSGTYAVDPYTIIVKTSAQVTSPYPTADDKDAARAIIESWFAVREITGTDTYGDPLAIDHIDFSTTNATLNAFVIVLSNPLDNTKDYEVFYNNGYVKLDVAKEVAVTINVTVPANTPAASVISAAGSMQGWTPGDVNYTATQVGTTNVYTLTFNVSVTDPYTAIEYKWTRGDWPSNELIDQNRKLYIPNNVDSITFDDTVSAWADVEPSGTVGVAPDYTPMYAPDQLVQASIDVAMDTEAPVITFISPSGIVGVDEAQRIITVAWGEPFDQNLFPRFRASDDRDGDLTPFVYVPKGDYSVLDTRTEGNYQIMLRVVDKWGNVTEEMFTFSVVKAN